MRQILSRINKPIVILFLVWLVLAIVNFSPDTLFSSWDNLHPEFNFGLNFKRAIFGVWQEHQGLGHIGGHGYAATLPHILLTWILSWFVPINQIRIVFTLLTLLVGATGCYFLVSHLLKQKPRTVASLGALLGSLYYMLNFATIQQYYIQLEAFIVHFAALPWLLYFVLTLLNQWNTKVFLVFLFVSFIASTQGFIPPLFIVYVLILLMILASYVLFGQSKARIQTSLVIFFSTLLINAYWLLPVVHYSLMQSNTFLNAYNNLLSTQSWIETNSVYGTLKDLAILRGFPSQALDIGGKTGQQYIFQPWQDHLTKPWVSWLGYGFFALMIAGLILFLKSHKSKHEWVFVIIAILLFSMLASQVAGLSRVSNFIQELPLFRQAFRAGFTKLSIALALCYSIFFAYATAFLPRKINTLAGFVFGGLIVLTALPAFGGNLFYKKAQLAFPSAYFQLFEFFKKQDPAGRIMTLPQGDHWGWDTYRWGYTGSGFLWFGLPQPITERAFDVWSRYNENYWWELSYALYSKNHKLFENILDKYQIRWIIFDTSVVSYPSNKYAIYTETTEEILSYSTKLSRVAELPIDNPQGDSIVIYKVNGTDISSNHVSLADSLPADTSPYRWTNIDQAFDIFGLYTSGTQLADDRFFFPFRSLFTGRQISERSFDINDTDTHFIFSANNISGSTLSIPSYSTEDLADIPIDALDKVYFVGLDLYLDGKLLRSVKPEDSQVQEMKLPDDFGGKLEVVFPKIWGYFSYDSNNPGSILPNIQRCDNKAEGVLNTETLTTGVTTVYRLTNAQSSTCADIYIPTLTHKYGYLVTIESKNVTGDPLTLHIINGTSRRDDLTLLLPKGPSMTASYIVLPPMQNDGLGYSIRLANTAIGTNPSVNEFGTVTVNPIPFNFLTSLYVTSSPIRPPSTVNYLPSTTVSHPNPAYYKISLQSSDISNQTLDCLKTEGCGLTTLLLYQSFDPGWKAYEMPNCQLSTINCQLKQALPFLFGREIKEHVLVNNWANGWRLQSSDISYQSSDCLTTEDLPRRQAGCRLTTVVIFFLPQLLQWVGFLLLPIPFVYILLKKKN